MNRILYPKDEELKPGTWNRWKVPSGHSILFCDTNGHIGSLDDHQIKADGTVDPSVWCPDPNCNFHEWIILQNWDSV